MPPRLKLKGFRSWLAEEIEVIGAEFAVLGQMQGGVETTDTGGRIG